MNDFMIYEFKITTEMPDLCFRVRVNVVWDLFGSITDIT